MIIKPNELIPLGGLADHQTAVFYDEENDCLLAGKMVKELNPTTFIKNSGIGLALYYLVFMASKTLNLKGILPIIIGQLLILLSSKIFDYYLMRLEYDLTEFSFSDYLQAKDFYERVNRVLLRHFIFIIIDLIALFILSYLYLLSNSIIFLMLSLVCGLIFWRLSAYSYFKRIHVVKRLCKN